VTTFVLASANPDKANEIVEILGESATLLPRPDEVPDIPETGTTLLENARLKARAIVDATHRPAIADDTGLEVDALGGAPGVYSARFAGENASYRDNVAKLLRELTSVPEPRVARFRTVAIAVYPNGDEICAEGSVAGWIATQSRGGGGFGYDSVFVPASGDGRTFAEMGQAEKNAISHRGAAFRALRQRLEQNLKSS
jgi:XTP/dITP diphosphohydrolase